MAKLTPNRRAKLPAREFGLPEKARSSAAKKETGNYPMPDKGHAISAKQRSRAQRKAGNLTNDGSIASIARRTRFSTSRRRAERPTAA